MELLVHIKIKGTEEEMHINYFNLSSTRILLHREKFTGLKIYKLNNIHYIDKAYKY